MAKGEYSPGGINRAGSRRLRPLFTIRVAGLRYSGVRLWRGLGDAVPGSRGKGHGPGRC